MPFYNFDHNSNKKISIDELPDHRSEIQKQFTPLAAFNHDRPDLAMYERQAEEIINISGAWVTLFLKEPMNKGQGLPKMNPGEHWDEDNDPQYRLGIKLKAYIKLSQWQIELTRWGIDSPIKVEVKFARAILAKAVGLDRMLTPGDVIDIPYNRAKIDTPLRFRVVNETDSGNIHYRWMYYSAACELITGDQSIHVPFEGRKI